MLLCVCIYLCKGPFLPDPSPSELSLSRPRLLIDSDQLFLGDPSWIPPVAENVGASHRRDCWSVHTCSLLRTALGMAALCSFPRCCPLSQLLQWAMTDRWHKGPAPLPPKQDKLVHQSWSGWDRPSLKPHPCSDSSPSLSHSPHSLTGFFLRTLH